MGAKPRAGSAGSSTLKTRRTSSSVANFVEAIPHDLRRRDALTLLALFRDVTGQEPCMWGTKIVGFGSYSYRYESGRTGQWLRTGFAPGKSHSSIYIMPGFGGQESLLSRLGPHKHSVSCLYLRNLDEVDQSVLRMLILNSLAIMEGRYPS